jgi:hypothetical protein
VADLHRRLPESRCERLRLAAAMTLAAVLRMGWSLLTEFAQDEAHLYSGRHRRCGAHQARPRIVAQRRDVCGDMAPAVFHALLRDRPHRFVDGRMAAVLPRDESVVVLWPADQGYAWPLAAAYDECATHWHTVPLPVGDGHALLAAGQPAGEWIEFPR